MKNHRNFKFLITFGFIFFLSIGYAVVNSVSLTVTGNAQSQNYNLKVQTSGNTYVSNTNKGKIKNLTADKFDIEVNDLELNETIYFEVELVNNETDVTATSANETFSNQLSEYFDVDCRIGEGLSGTSQSFLIEGYCDNFVIPPGGKKTARISISLIKTPITEEETTTAFSFIVDMIPSN